jgi:hypothetical protein
MATTSVSSGGGMLRKEEESEAEVRREDQDNINKFARLNARLQEVRGEISSLKVRLIVNYRVPYRIFAIPNSAHFFLTITEQTRGD